MDSLSDAAQKRIGTSIAKTLSAYLKTLSGTDTPPSKEQLEQPFLPEADPGLVQETETLIATALLLGMDHASRKLNAGDEEIPPLPFEEAVSFMKSRIPVTKAEWTTLEPKLRFRAFTVARLAQCDYIDAARQVLSNAIETGKGVAETYKQWQTLQTLVQDDAMRLRPGYWENVFRTNTQTSYTAGKLMRFRDNPPPAWRLLIIDDSRTSDICRGLLREGKRDIAMAYDHPFWKEFGFPSYHYQCRTGLQAVYKSEIAAGAVIENPDMEDMRTRFKPMDGFGGNPLEKESWWMMTKGMAKRAGRYGIDGDAIIMAKSLGMENYAMDMLRGLKTFYIFDSGGYVKKAKLANPGKENIRVKNHWIKTDELGAATRAAKAGHKIYFLPRVKKDGISDLDTIINNELADIKHIFTPTENAIKKALDRAKKQGALAVLLEIVTPDLTDSFVDVVIKEHIGSRIKYVIVSQGGNVRTVTK